MPRAQHAPPMPRCRIIVSLREPLARLGLRALLARDPDLTVVHETGDGLRALRETDRVRPDLLVLDTGCLDGAWDDLARRRAESEIVNLLFLSRPGELRLRELLAAGSASCAMLDEDPDALLDTVRASADGEIRISRRVLSHAFRSGAPGAAPEAELSRREHEVLWLLAHGLDNRAIAGRLFITHGTVKNHLTHIYGKLGVRERTEAVAWAWRNGLAQHPDPSPAVATPAGHPFPGRNFTDAAGASGTPKS